MLEKRLSPPDLHCESREGQGARARARCGADAWCEGVASGGTCPPSQLTAPSPQGPAALGEARTAQADTRGKDSVLHRTQDLVYLSGGQDPLFKEP